MTIDSVQNLNNGNRKDDNNSFDTDDTTSRPNIESGFQGQHHTH